MKTVHEFKIKFMEAIGEEVKTRGLSTTGPGKHYHWHVSGYEGDVLSVVPLLCKIVSMPHPTSLDGKCEEPSVKSGKYKIGKGRAHANKSLDTDIVASKETTWEDTVYVI